MSWVSVKEKLPNEGEFVRVKMLILFTSEEEAIYLKKYFVRKGEDITKWVTHWKISNESLDI